MGNSLGCFSSHDHSTLQRQPSTSSFQDSSLSRRSSSTTKKTQRSSSSARLKNDKDLALQHQAMVAALLFKEYQKNGGQRDTTSSFMMNRSNSVVYPSPAKKPGFTRSSSSRQRSGSDTVVLPQDFVVSQDQKSMEGLETKHFVLVHGGGFGAWCWYKTITLLEDSGFKVNAVDLTASGVQSSDTNSVANLVQYVKPLTDLLHKLDNDKKVILVGHDFGGACISYAMELFPSKISKAIFVAATMLSNGQSTLDLFSRQIGPDDLMHQAQIVLYANGKDQPPTAIDHNKELLKDLFFNQTPSKDVALASVSMRSMPFAPITEKLHLSSTNYGSVRRFYIVTQEDQVISASLQESMIETNPPEHVFRVKGSDHSPFFSKPQALHKIFVEIALLPPK